MMFFRLVIILALAFTASACSKKDDAPAAEATATSAKSSLPWTPTNYDAMSPTCKKALACCEEVATSEGAKSASDYNGKCSGPALWDDDGCETDLQARVTLFEADGKPVPDACK